MKEDIFNEIKEKVEKESKSRNVSVVDIAIKRTWSRCCNLIKFETEKKINEIKG